MRLHLRPGPDLLLLQLQLLVALNARLVGRGLDPQRAWRAQESMGEASRKIMRKEPRGSARRLTAGTASRIK